MEMNNYNCALHSSRIFSYISILFPATFFNLNFVLNLFANY